VSDEPTPPSSPEKPWGRWKDFHVWRGRLPHWRAEGVLYYVEFKHRRALDEGERGAVLEEVRRSDAKRWDVTAALVLPEITRLLVRAREDPRGGDYELSEIVERAKNRAGKAIVKKSGERFPPFFNESYDRIPRDEAEVEEIFLDLLAAPEREGLADDPESYPFLWVPEAA
jgi:hypothetical protein